MSTPPPAVGAQAALRVARTIALVAGVATLVFFSLAIGPVIASDDYLDSGFNVAATVAVFGIPPVLAVVGLFIGLATLRRLLGAYALIVLAVVIAWVPTMSAPLPTELAPWPLEVTALGTVPAAIAWRAPWAWTYLVVNSVLIAPVRYLAADQTDLTVPLQFALFTLTFSAIFTALAMVAMRNGYALDAATEAARAATARAAAAASHARERARVDGLVHDNVMGTLFYASRGGLDDSVRRQAGIALAQLERLRGGHHQLDDPVDAGEFVARIRAVVLDPAPGLAFLATGGRKAPVPHDVASAFVEASSEAVRNSLAHAGPGSPETLSVRVDLSEQLIRVVVSDEGVGFDPRSVTPHRLGLAVSIRGRIDAIPGGHASVSSRPGAGTVVILSWAQP